MPKDENKKTVRQKDADELHATAKHDPASPPTAITGNVGILDSLDARINPAKEDGNLSSIKTNTDNLDITQSSFRDAIRGANTKDFSTLQTVLDSIKNTDGIKKITDTVTVSATDLDIRNLAKAQDEVYAVLKTDAGVAYDARDRSWTITESIPVTGTFWQETQPVSGTFWQATQPVSGTVTVTDVSAIKTAVEKIDNQEDSIPYVDVAKAGDDGYIIEPPGEGFLRIHHLYVSNWSANLVFFHVREEEAGGDSKFSFCLAASGGGFAQNLKRPLDLSEGKGLFYDFVSGTDPSVYITVGYENIIP